uniref:hypothetical protein n=1 Tax=Vibrio hyugaensis TaxID=1534743 RepID=UPI0005EE2417
DSSGFLIKPWPVLLDHYTKLMSKLTSKLPTRKEYSIAMYEALSVVEHPATKYSVASREVNALACEIRGLLSI